MSDPIAPPAGSCSHDDREEAQRLAVAFLNENFEPWTFSGPEPVTEALVALLLRVRAGVHARPVNELVAGADRL